MDREPTFPRKRHAGGAPWLPGLRRLRRIFRVLSAWAPGADNPGVVPPDDGYAPRSDDVRASDAERDQVIGELKERYIEGRLTHECLFVRVMRDERREKRVFGRFRLRRRLELRVYRPSCRVSR